MKAKNILIAIVAFGVLISYGARAAGDSTVPDSANKEVKKSVQVVTFAVPDLSKSLAKDISKALASEPGVLSGKPNFERKAFLVTYESGKTSPMKIQKIMKAVTTDTKLENVAPAPEKSGNQGCGKCPRRNSCVKYNN